MVETTMRPSDAEAMSPEMHQAQAKLMNILNASRLMTSNRNLYEHIVSVVDFIVRNYPRQALDKFEEVSYLIKNGDKQKLEEFLQTQDCRDYACHDDQLAKHTAKHIEKANKFFNVEAEPVPATEGEAAEEIQPNAPCGFIPDITHDNHALWQWAGINFGEFTCMMLQKSLATLAASAGVANLRFWGKVSGTKQDYYIAEGTGEAAAEGGESAEPVVGFESRGTPGANQFGYWVCNSPDEGKWVALPDISPDDIAASRSIKVLFTGDLNRQIVTNPFFTKTEMFYLRAQICRISQSTTLVPKGVYRLNEEDRNVIEENTPEEGPVPIPSTKQMGSLDFWTHYQRSILRCNRLTIMDPELGEEEDPEEGRKKAEAKDPQQPLLKPVTSDDATKGGACAWSIRKFGDQTVYGAANPFMADLHYGVVVVRSNVWPGSFTFFQNGAWSQIYLGNGHKFEEETFYPVCPPKLCADPEEPCSHEEPNPTPAALAEKAKAAENVGEVPADDE